MRVATGTVIDGKIVVEGMPLAEGDVVTIVSRGVDEKFVLTEAQEDELLASLAEIERGEFVTPEELLESLPKRIARPRLTQCALISSVRLLSSRSSQA